MICPTNGGFVGQIIYREYIVFLSFKKKKKLRKIRKKNPSKDHPRARTLVDIKEKFPDQFFPNMQITSEPLFFRSKFLYLCFASISLRPNAFFGQ